jgi:hypothetical protein
MLLMRRGGFLKPSLDEGLLLLELSSPSPPLQFYHPRFEGCILCNKRCNLCLLRGYHRQQLFDRDRLRGGC